MIKVLVLIILTLPVVGFSDNNTGAGFTVDITKKKDDLSLHLNLLKTTNIVEARYGKFGVGARYRLHSNYKVGAFLEEDWGVILRTLVRVESSPRFLLSFLPGEKWVLKLGHSAFHNTDIGRSGWRISPELRYYWFRNGAPFINFGYRFEEDRVFNKKTFETLALRKHYGSIIYHYDEELLYRFG